MNEPPEIVQDIPPLPPEPRRVRVDQIIIRVDGDHCVLGVRDEEGVQPVRKLAELPADVRAAVELLLEHARTGRP